MSTTATLAPAPPITLDDDELVIAEFNLPHVEETLEEQAEAERERYDEQILAALVCV